MFTVNRNLLILCGKTRSQKKGYFGAKQAYRISATAKRLNIVMPQTGVNPKRKIKTIGGLTGHIAQLLQILN